MSDSEKQHYAQKFRKSKFGVENLGTWLSKIDFSKNGNVQIVNDIGDSLNATTELNSIHNTTQDPLGMDMT